MRKFRTIVAALVLAGGLSGAAVAQDAAKAPAAKVDIPKGVFYKGQGPTQFLVKDRLIGQKVQTKAGETIGTIEDVIIGSSDNAIDGVVIGVGGFLGVGEKKVGVRYKQLDISRNDKGLKIVLDTSKAVLAALEPYTTLEQRKTLLDKARDAAKAAAAQAKDLAAKGAAAAKEAAAKAEAEAKAAMDRAKAGSQAPAPAAAPKQ